MASKRNLGSTDFDTYFDLPDENTRLAFRQLFDNNRSLINTIKLLEDRVDIMEASLIATEAKAHEH